MVAILELFADPGFVVALALLIFVLRVVYLARTLKMAAKHPTLADLRALERAKESLHAHRESLGEAREELDANLDAARDTLRRYRGPLARAKADRVEAIRTPMARLREYRIPFERAQRARREALAEARGQRAFREAKALIQRSRERIPAPKRAAAAAPKDI